MRLISFVGTGNYSETTYALEGETCRTRYVAHALATFLRPTSIQLIATAEAWAQHGTSLAGVLTTDGHPTPERITVHTGGAPEQLWDMFGKIVEAIRTADEVVVDITHGFRMQPFFAAACLQYVQAVVPHPPTVRVMYGEFRATEPTSPLWELTPFLEVLSWSRNLMMFLRTGQADEVAATTETMGRELSRQWAMSGQQGAPSQLRALAQALSAFSNDFTTIRTGPLLIGRQPSAQRLLDAIERTRDEVAQQLPALSLVLDQVRAMVEPLCTHGARLSSQAGQQALIALARLYQRMGRISEAMSVLREGWITMGAPPTTDMPTTNDFNHEQRLQLDQAWGMRLGQPDPVAQPRNDLLHAGFTARPLPASSFTSLLNNRLNEWQAAIDAMADPTSE